MPVKKTRKIAKVARSPQNKLSKQPIPIQAASFPIVGIGASAGGLEAFESFFKSLSANTGMAFVIVTHLDKTHISILPDILQRYTPMKVQPIKNGVKTHPNHVYIIPPNKNIDIQKGIFHLKSQPLPHYTNLPINFFFKSLAKECKEFAAGVILSGLGSDGTLGIKLINEAGGIVIVQDPVSAKFDGMPLAAINTDLADYILPPEKIPGQLAKWFSNEEVSEKKTFNDLQKILFMLKTFSGHDFFLYKQNTVRRRIKRQMMVHQISTMANYVSYLQSHPQEINSLFNDILIGVTSFFRDPDAFEVLKDKIINHLRSNKHDSSFRIWVPGCSTGEEVYSLAIIVSECLKEISDHRSIHIFGTDIDIRSLEIARIASYPKIISKNISAERLEKFFIEEKNAYKAKKEIRDMVVFGIHNIIKDTSFTKMDIISCRNLLIYFTSDLQKRIFPIFHYSLKQKGLLFLGASEAINSQSDLFRSITKKWNIFERKDSKDLRSRNLINANSDAAYSPNSRLSFHLNDNFDQRLNLVQTQEIKRFLINHSISSGVIVNSHGDVLYVHGSINSYLRFVPQQTKFNIFEAILPKLCLALSAAIRKTTAEKKELIHRNMHLDNDKNFKFDLKVIPLAESDHLNHCVCVVFEKKPPKAARGKAKMKNKLTASLSKKNEELETKLQHTKESLQCIIEELQSSNEELQSTNEELQSTNEELETAKEEMQSLNEELIILNTELQYRIDQSTLANDDMINLFNSTGVMAIFLDNNMRIKRFTPEVKDLINLIQSDIGRSINDFSLAIQYNDLIKDSKEVIHKLNQKILEVQGTNSRWYQVRIIPYKTISNAIDGVIITFNDISYHKETENALIKVNMELKAAIKSQDQPSG